MANKRVPDEVQKAIALARASGWDVSIRNEKVGIIAPDGVKIVVGMNPNTESMKTFRNNAAKYNLVGDGPAMTPTQQEEQIREAEAAGLAEAERMNKKRQEYEAEQAAKRAQVEAAAQKAAEATARGMNTTTTLEEPVPNAIPSYYPTFDSALIGTRDYQALKLKNGRFFCPECLSQGQPWSSSAPQGLATHRGFRHQMYKGEAVSDPTVTTEETSRVTLPADIYDAFELVKSVVADHLSQGDSEQVAALEAQLAEIKGQAESDLKKADAEYDELKKTSTAALAAQKAKVHELTKELTGKEGVYEAQGKALLKNFQDLLLKIRDAVNTLSPAQAVGKIDELLSSYLDS